jgi:hypothetical protein
MHFPSLQTKIQNILYYVELVHVNFFELTCFLARRPEADSSKSNIANDNKNADSQ